LSLGIQCREGNIEFIFKKKIKEEDKKKKTISEEVMEK
jgi:hypothetical protein